VERRIEGREVGRPVQPVRSADAGPVLLARLRALCDRAFGDAYSDDDWHNALGGVHLVAWAGAEPVAHAAVVRRTLEVDGQPIETGYVEAVATDPARQGQGHGSAVMRAANEHIRATYPLGALSTGRWDLYGRLGWERWRGRTWVRDGTELRRTEDDDDGIMVLRFGSTAGLELSAPIVCRARPGDDW
jgi:aminoglycoside 2'-N-acetyltransferase I